MIPASNIDLEVQGICGWRDASQPQWELVREICGTQSCSVVLSRDKCNGTSLGNLLNLQPTLSAASSS